MEAVSPTMRTGLPLHLCALCVLEACVAPTLLCFLLTLHNLPALLLARRPHPPRPGCSSIGLAVPAIQSLLVRPILRSVHPRLASLRGFQTRSSLPSRSTLSPIPRAMIRCERTERQHPPPKPEACATSFTGVGGDYVLEPIFLSPTASPLQAARRALQGPERSDISFSGRGVEGKLQAQGLARVLPPTLQSAVKRPRTVVVKEGPARLLLRPERDLPVMRRRRLPRVREAALAPCPRRIEGHQLRSKQGLGVRRPREASERS